MTIAMTMMSRKIAIRRFLILLVIVLVLTHFSYSTPTRHRTRVFALLALFAPRFFHPRHIMIAATFLPRLSCAH